MLLLEVADDVFIKRLRDYQKNRENIEHAFIRKFFVQMVEAVCFIHDRGE